MGLSIAHFFLNSAHDQPQFTTFPNAVAATRRSRVKRTPSSRRGSSCARRRAVGGAGRSPQGRRGGDRHAATLGSGHNAGQGASRCGARAPARDATAVSVRRVLSRPRDDTGGATEHAHAARIIIRPRAGETARRAIATARRLGGGPRGGWTRRETSTSSVFSLLRAAVLAAAAGGRRRRPVVVAASPVQRDRDRARQRGQRVGEILRGDGLRDGLEVELRPDPTQDTRPHGCATPRNGTIEEGRPIPSTNRAVAAVPRQTIGWWCARRAVRPRARATNQIAPLARGRSGRSRVEEGGRANSESVSVSGLLLAPRRSHRPSTRRSGPPRRRP